MIKTWVFVLALTVISAAKDLGAVHGFFLGFIEGMQRDSSSSSDCLIRLPDVSSAYASLEQGIESRHLGNFLVSVRDLVNEMTLFEKACQFEPLLAQVFDIFTVDGIQQLGVLLVANLNFYIDTIAELQQALANWITYDIGFHLGQLISKTTNYYF